MKELLNKDDKHEASHMQTKPLLTGVLYMILSFGYNF